MTKALAEPIWARGGKILIRSHVKEILIEGGQAVGVRVLPCFVGDHNKGRDFRAELNEKESTQINSRTEWFGNP